MSFRVDDGTGFAVTGLTTGTLPKAASATTLTDSLVSESGGTVTVSGDFVTTGAFAAVTGPGVVGETSNPNGSYQGWASFSASYNEIAVYGDGVGNPTHYTAFWSDGVNGGIYSNAGNLDFGVVAGGVITLSAPTIVSGPVVETFDYAAPSTGNTVTMAANIRRQILEPAGTLSTLTVVLPPSPRDGQVVGVGSSQIITTLTVNAGTGAATVVAAPTTLAAGGTFSMIYRETGNKWHRTA